MDEWIRDKYKILIVDDDPTSVAILQDILCTEYHAFTAENGLQGYELAQQLRPDLILMDIIMPEVNGMQACQLIKAHEELKEIPIIFLTSKDSVMDEAKGFDAGAVDYIHKPVSPPLLKRRIRIHLSLVNAERLDKLATESIHMLGKASHFNDDDTGMHIWRMASYATAIAKSIGWPQKRVEQLNLAATMHDTGKIGIPDTILKAPRVLTEEEWTIMKKHSQIGHDILSNSLHPVFQLAAVIALTHHEKYDGSGYPKGLAEEEIPKVGRIVAIADVFDALTMKRCYKQAWSVDASFDYIRDQAGKHFDKGMALSFLAQSAQIIELRNYWEKREETMDL